MNPNIQITMKEIKMSDLDLDMDLEQENLDILSELLNMSSDEEENEYIVEQLIQNEYDMSIHIEYEENTIKQLMRIVDYYKIKIPKQTKKIDIINEIITFEQSLSNHEIVNKRKILWHYISELKSDSFMKQFVFWS